MRLGNDASLQRYCVKHKLGEEFSCDPRTLRAKLYCPIPSENCNETTDGGVFFRHVGCRNENPFWNADKGLVDIPGDPEQTTVAFQLDFGFGGDVERLVRVQHWLLGVLRHVPREYPEMWYPAMLLRATAESNSPWQRVGVLVELAGAKESGKSVLAMMSMNQSGYVRAGAGSLDIEVRDFIYSSHTNVGQFRRYIETLHLATLLKERRRSELFLPQGTFRSRNIKALFIKPSKNWQIATDDGVDETDGWPKRYARKALFAVPHLFKRFANQTTLLLWQLVHSANTYPFWYTVVFYDTSGEANDEQDLNLDLEAIDKVAIVVNAREIFGLEKPSIVSNDDTSAASVEAQKTTLATAPASIADQSIKTAYDRIVKGVDRKQKLYIVVTQMDAIKHLIPSDWERVEAIANSAGSKKLNRDAKELLSSWLEKSKAPHASDLKTKLRSINGVYFVWTEGLPRTMSPSNNSTFPHSRGLVRFICDCLDVTSNQITK